MVRLFSVYRLLDLKQGHNKEGKSILYLIFEYKDTALKKYIRGISTEGEEDSTELCRARNINKLTRALCLLLMSMQMLNLLNERSREAHDIERQQQLHDHQISLNIPQRSSFKKYFQEAQPWKDKATLRRDEFSQEALLKLLLHNYLHYSLYDQAEKLMSKAPRFEAHSNQQFYRYLFYLGKIRTIQLEYTDAKESLLQATRKAPIAARGFKIQCNKWDGIVRLLLGKIPERTVFMQKGMKKALTPYFELTNAVQIGDLEVFRSVAEKFSSTFSMDMTQNLMVRLRHNVIRTGLRNISISYSFISLALIEEKLE